MKRHFILNESGEVVHEEDLITWARWYETHRWACVIAMDHITKDVRVSTVFLALNYAMKEEDTPILFETCVFGGPHHLMTKRYGTRDEAMAGHVEMCARMLNVLGMVK